MKQLQQQNRWCLWRYEKDKEGRTVKKVPYNLDGRAKVNDPGTWIDYKTADMFNLDRQYNGIGLFFSANFCGIDIDGDHSENGAHNPLEAEILQLFQGTYAERSPSGTGVHILFTVDKSQLPCVTETTKTGTKTKLDPRFYLKNPTNDLEFYAGGLTDRFFTYTGNRISAGDEVTDQTEAVLTFLDRYMLRPTRNKPSDRKTNTPQFFDPVFGPAAGPAAVNVEARLNVARNAKNGEKFRKLYDLGDTSDFIGDDSAADQALCAMLAFYLNGDPTLIDDAFRNSKLYRPKWDERHGPDTYGALTIKKAVDTLTDVYHEPRYTFKYRPEADSAADLTDAGNAEVFVRLYGDRVRWCDALGWLMWDGKVWQDDAHKVEALALELSRDMLLEAYKAMQETQIIDENGRMQCDPAVLNYFQHAKKTRGATGQKNMLTLAKAWLAIPAKDLDADAYTLNTEAGLINLHTGVCRPHDPKAFCTKIAPFKPSTEGADMWEDFLNLVTNHDDELKAYLKQVCGMSVIGAVKDECVQIAYGGGRNGKSTFFNALQNVLDSYSGSLDADTLTTDKYNKGASLATLRGKRLVICGELEEGQRLSLKELKRVAATDKLVIEQKYKDPETIRPTHHLCMFTNHLPRVGSSDDGTWRRLAVIPFSATMPSGDAEIKDYAEVLSTNAGGAILQWLIDGAREYLANGCKLAKPAAVEGVTNEYRQREDWQQRFINECCVRDTDPKARTLASDLYAAYKIFTAANGAFTKKSVDFTDGMKRMGFISVSISNRLTWLGIRIDQGAIHRWSSVLPDEAAT